MKSSWIEMLRELSVFRDATRTELARLAGAARQVEAPRNAEILRQDEVADALYLIVSGRVVLHRDGVEAGSLGPGELLGKSLFVGPAPQLATAVVAEPCQLLRIDRRRLLEVLACRAELMLVARRAVIAGLAQAVQR